MLTGYNTAIRSILPIAMKRGEVRRIARETQLSASTVSRVLRGVVKPRWETKIKIDKAKDKQ